MGEREKSTFKATGTVYRISIDQWLDQIPVLRETDRGNYLREVKALRREVSVNEEWTDYCCMKADPFLWY